MCPGHGKSFRSWLHPPDHHDDVHDDDHDAHDDDHHDDKGGFDLMMVIVGLWRAEPGKVKARVVAAEN